MTRLWACLVKESRLISRDLHGLALLFLLPLAFILVMSLALQDAFDARAGRGLAVLVQNSDGGEMAQQIADALVASDAYAATAASGLDRGALTELARRGDVAFAVEIGAGFDAWLASGDGEPVTIVVGPAVDQRSALIFTNVIRRSLAVARMTQIMTELGHEPEGAVVPEINVVHSYGETRRGQPSAVQQNVPAWLVFAVFFIAIPFSNTFIRERQLGTFRRLRTIAVSPLTQLLGKLGPHFVINQLQVATMLAVGVFVVPLLGGDALELNGSPAALVLLAVALSLAALGLALLIAVLAHTTEQATMASGLGNIVLAAVGGIMVPAFVMPTAMQSIAQLSPMAWGLDGFLVLLLHDGGIADIAPQLLKLAGFGATTLGLAWLRFRYLD